MDMKIRNEFKIVLFGDSIAKGVYFDNEKGRYEIVENGYLSGKLKAGVINAGKFGMTLAKGVSRLGKDVLSRNPNIVLLEFGGNDCDFDWDSVEKNPSAHHKPKTELMDFKIKLTQMLCDLKEKGIKPFLMTLPPLVSERYLKWLSKDSSSRYYKILTWLGSVSQIYYWHETYDKVIREVAEETHTDMIDIRHEFLTKTDNGDYMSRDGIHPNKEGYKLMGDKIADYFRKKYYFPDIEKNSGMRKLLPAGNERQRSTYQ